MKKFVAWEGEGEGSVDHALATGAERVVSANGERALPLTVVAGAVVYQAQLGHGPVDVVAVLEPRDGVVAGVQVHVALADQVASSRRRRSNLRILRACRCR